VTHPITKFKRKRIYFAFVLLNFLFLFTSSRIDALELIGDKLHFYGTFNESFDYMDSDITEQQASADFDVRLLSNESGISSNTTKIGVKGNLPFTGETDFVYQVEQFVDLDSNERVDFSTRNTYLGISGDFGQVLIGRYDSPFKLVSSRYSVLSDTIGDRRAILGASATSGNRLNLRADNMILWRNKTALASGTFDWIIQYSAKANKNSSAAC
jgi:predicted porin